MGNYFSGNFTISPYRINSLAVAVQQIYDNRKFYDINLINKIVLDFNRYLSETNRYWGFTGEYTTLDKDQYDAFIRINKMIDELKPTNLEIKEKNEKDI